ncbi:MAG: hypothetical protein IPM93_14440 [Candidatus Obscuribacter sp.]|nr:hypothetical protein [Candidatus Obscuribacter sp.]
MPQSIFFTVPAREQDRNFSGTHRQPWTARWTALGLVFGLLPVMGLVSVSAVQAEEANAGEVSFNKRPTPSNLVDLVRQAKVVNPDYPLHVLISGNFATVMTRRHPKAKDEDLKIDAVLITKSILDAYGYCLDGVRVLYRDEDGSNGKRIAVAEADIKNYAAGTMEPQRFLDSLKMVSIDGELDNDPRHGNKAGAAVSELSVSPGPFEDQRLLLLDRINALRKRGTGVGPYEQLFLAMDQSARNQSSEEVRKQVKALAERLGEQEQLCRQAELVSRGKGVQGTTSTASASSPNEARIKESLKAAGLDGHRMVDKVGDDLNYMQRMGLDVNSLRAELKAAEQAMDKDPAAGMKALRQIKEKMYAAAQNAGPRHVPGGQFQGPNGMPGGQHQGQMPPGGQYPPMH